MLKLRDIFCKSTRLTKNDIRKYLDRDTTNKERHEIEKIMSSSSLNEDAMEGFEEFGIDELDKIPSFNKFKSKVEFPSSSHKIHSISPYINRIAAAMIGVVTMMGSYMYWNDSAPERTFAEQFQGYDDPKMFELRDGNSEDGTAINTVLQQGTSHYLDEDYSEAIVYFETYLEENIGEPQATFYLGVSHLQTKNPKKAIEYLSVVAGLDSEYNDSAKWFLALAQIKMREEESAKETLRDLEKNGPPFYARKAKTLLEQIE